MPAPPKYLVPCWGTGTSASYTDIATIVWDTWNTSYTNSSASSVTWTNWTRTYGTGNSASLAQSWTHWVRSASSVRVSEEQAQADLRELRRQADAQRARRIEVETERAKARERAALLLQESLSEQQRLELAEKGHFSLRVIDSKTNEEKLYRIRRGRTANVDRIDASGRVLHRLCAHPVIACPDEDTMLAQKLMLENDEASFLRMANVHSAR